MHEIGHTKNVIGDHNHSCSTHSCSEHRANTFMVHKKIKQYVALGNESIEANYINVATSLGINNYDDIRESEELLKYVTKKIKCN